MAMMMFLSEAGARKYFGPGIDVETCEVCGEWTASQADHNEGGIIGPRVFEDGTNEYDRICEDCDIEIDICEAEGV